MGPRNKLCHRVCSMSVYNCAYNITGKSLPTLDLPRGTQGPEAAASTAVFVYGTGPSCLPPHLPLLAGPCKPTANNFCFVSFTCEHIV